MNIKPYNSKTFSPSALWQKLSLSSKRLGRETVEKVLWLYYASRRAQTPQWAKTLIYSTLAYFILPLDAIPDFIPITGYTDDLAAISAALATIAMYIDDDVKQKAAEKIEHWFGDTTNDATNKESDLETITPD